MTCQREINHSEPDITFLLSVWDNNLPTTKHLRNYRIQTGEFVLEVSETAVELTTSDMGSSCVLPHTGFSECVCMKLCVYEIVGAVCVCVCVCAVCVCVCVRIYDVY